MFRFESLEIWKMAVQYGLKIYKITDTFPTKEVFGLSSQLRRASVSISSNIAEGSGGSLKDFCNYLDISVKSTLEVASQLMFAKEIGYINSQILNELYLDAEVLIKRVRSFKAYLKRNNKP